MIGTFEKTSGMFELLAMFISSLSQFLESGWFVPWSQNQLTGWHFQSGWVYRIKLSFWCHQTLWMVELNQIDDAGNPLFRRVQIDLKGLLLILLNNAAEMLVTIILLRFWRQPGDKVIGWNMPYIWSTTGNSVRWMRRINGFVMTSKQCRLNHQTIPFVHIRPS
jgi:hypothetical protein